MSTAAYNRSKIRHLQIHARDCAYYNWEPCNCGLSSRLAGQITSSNAQKVTMQNSTPVNTKNRALLSGSWTNQSVPCVRRPLSPCAINIYDPSCWCNTIQMLQERSKKATDVQERCNLSKVIYPRNIYASYPSVMRTYHGERVIVPSMFPNTEPPYGWGFRNTLYLKEQTDDHTLRYLNLLHNGAPFRNRFFKPADVSGRNGVANGFWPFGGPK